MNWLPSAPTDNIYKFFAIIGVWCLLFFAGGLLAVEYQRYEYAEFTRREQILLADDNWVLSAERRVNSLKNGRDGENAIPDLSGKFAALKDELLFLDNAIRLTKQRMVTMKERVKEPPVYIIPFLVAFRIDIVLASILAIGLLFSWVGFRKWYELQRFTDELLRLDWATKKAQIEDVAKTARSPRSGSASSQS